MQVKMRDEKTDGGGYGKEVGQGLWEGREGRLKNIFLRRVSVEKGY